jgi:hypothetical protein
MAKQILVRGCSNVIPGLSRPDGRNSFQFTPCRFTPRDNFTTAVQKGRRQTLRLITDISHGLRAESLLKLFQIQAVRRDRSSGRIEGAIG